MPRAGGTEGVLRREGSSAGPLRPRARGHDGAKVPGPSRPACRGSRDGATERLGEGAWANPAPPCGLNPFLPEEEAPALSRKGRYPLGWRSQPRSLAEAQTPPP